MKKTGLLSGRTYTAYIPVIGFMLITLCLSSCLTQKDVEYLQDRDNRIKTFSESDLQDYKLKPYDELYIQISSLDDAAINMFSNSTMQQNLSFASMQPYGASLVAYSINKEGFLFLPVVGSIFVKDKTINQVSEILKDSLSNILSQPNVTVKLVNRFVTVLGEVRNPGHFAFSQHKLSIYDALGLAGDINEYGNRREVILTRNEDGKNIKIPIDLTRLDLLASDYYFLKPNDMIYVKPLKKRFWGMREFPFGILLSTISTALLFYSVVK